MKKIFLAILLLCIAALAQTQVTYTSFNGDFNSQEGIAGSIPISELVHIANYYGCSKWEKDLCLECSERYYFNKNGVCCEVSEYCRKFNKAEGVCQSCYQGYAIANGKCKVSALDNGCVQWSGNLCTQCSKKWFFDQSGVCKPVSDLCSTWNTNGNCLSCYGGYVLSNFACIVDPKPNRGEDNVLCSQWEGNTCRKCAQRAYANSNGLCIPVDDLCSTFDSANGNCLSCYGGYTLNNNKCVRSAVQPPSDPGCALWNSNSNICLKCSSRYYFDSLNVCRQVSDNCNTWHQGDGQCLTCYHGYALNNGQCQLAPEQKVSDVGCALWDWKKQVCLKCSESWVANASGVCVPVSDFCSTYDRSSGNCISCYRGYVLNQGKCQLAAEQKVSDVGCAQWNWDNQVCLKCSIRWALSNGKCVPVSDQCSSYDHSGSCVSCYEGYALTNGKCQLAPEQKVSDVGCALWDWKKQQCLRCSEGWAFNNQGRCTPVSDNCATYDRKSGACLTCYEGYNLNNGQCQLAPEQKVSDVGCALWDWKKQVCLKCSESWVANASGVCVPVSDFCSTYDRSNGNCLTCYRGYVLNQGKCQLAAEQKVSDVGCAQWDWDSQVCLKCSLRWALNNGKCVPVSDQCNSVDLISGDCTTCYDGYVLNNGKCSLTLEQNVSDVGCGQWDWKKQVCLKCSEDWVFNPSGVCIPVSDFCSTYDRSNGNCLTCYKGYALNHGKCQLAPEQKVSDVGCAQWNWDNQVCLKCSHRWVFNQNKVCIPVADSCAIHNAAGACTGCYNGYVLNQQGQCEQGNSLCRQAVSGGACSSCYTGYILSFGNCVPISKLANLALYYAQCCPQKLEELKNMTNNKPK